MSLEIEYLKNLRIDMEKSTEEMKEVHEIQLTKLNDKINCQNTEIAELKNEISGMQSSIDKRTAEVYKFI